MTRTVIPPTPGTAPLPTTRRSPWPIAIVAGLALVVVANAVYIYVALSHRDAVAASYTTEHR